MENVWDDNCSHAINLNSFQDLYNINEYAFIVWVADNKSDTQKVYFFDDKLPEYECGIFISSQVRFNIYYWDDNCSHAINLNSF